MDLPHLVPECQRRDELQGVLERVAMLIPDVYLRLFESNAKLTFCPEGTFSNYLINSLRSFANSPWLRGGMLTACREDLPELPMRNPKNDDTCVNVNRNRSLEPLIMFFNLTNLL